jgi:hypothetical protein
MVASVPQRGLTAPGETSVNESPKTQEFALSASDYAEFALFTWTRSRFHRRRFLATRLFMFSAGPVAVALDLATGFHPSLYADAGGVPGLIALAIISGGLIGGLAWSVQPALIRWSARRRFHDGSFAGYMKPQTVALSETGLHVQGGTGDSLITWDAVSEVASAGHAIYFFVSSMQAIIVPRRAFTDDRAEQNFVETALSFR